MAQGDLSVQTKSYTLNTSAQQKLERAGIDTRQFTECTGNLIQQDTHAKFIHTINRLADVRPTTDHGKLISNGTTDCALAGMQLNNEGHVREAMLYSDLCTLVVEKVLHVADNMNPFVLGTRALLDAATTGLHAASAHDLADSLSTLRTNIDEFRTGFVSGALHGATNITNIYEGLCNTVHALGEFAQSAIAFNAEQEALTYALESERYDDACSILAERSARAEQSAAVIHQLTGRITEFIDHMPDMTPQEWRDTGFATGDFVGREAAQLGAIHVGLRGLSRIGQGISNTIQHVETLSRELALSAQLSGNPTASSIADIVRQGHSVESVFTQNGSRFISGIPATHPEFGSHVLINTGEQFVESATQVFADTSSGIASRTASLLQLGKELGNKLTEAKPGFIQLPGSSKDVPAMASHSDTAPSENQHNDSSIGTLSSTSFVAQQQKFEGILQNCTPGDETTRSKLKQYDKRGTYNEILTDFNSLYFESIIERTTANGDMKIGTMKDGTKVIARAFSKGDGTYNGWPTLEIQFPNNKEIKIRYIT